MPAYLDHAATAPLRPSALAAMAAWLDGPVNPSGSHGLARAAGQAIDEVRDELASLLGTTPGDVVFTSGGTEAANLAVLGRAMAHAGAVVVSAVEHHCVLYAAQAACRLAGCQLRVVPVGRDGVVDLEALAAALDRGVTLVSVQLVNNETGVVQPLAEVARLVHRRSPQAVLHTDAVQAAPWYNLADLGGEADMVSISAHKFGGPHGVGALALRRPIELSPISYGGPQERERRAGTHNVAGIVGMGAALRCAASDRAQEVDRTAELRHRLRAGLLQAIAGAEETAPGTAKAPGHCHLLIPGVESESLLFLLDQGGVAASAGAACASGALSPSHVVLAMGYSPERALGALRLTLGHNTSVDEVDLALKVVPRAVARLRHSLV